MNHTELSDLIAAAGRLQGQLIDDEFDFCFIGGLAVHAWGEPRQTQDVDVTVWTEFGSERETAKRLLVGSQGRIADAADFAATNRVLLLEDSEGIAIDISLAAFPFERGLIDRATLINFGAAQLKLCTPSDLIILKAFANRAHDWVDIRGIMVRSESQLDWPLVFSELEVLAGLKEEPEILEKLEKLRKETL